MRYDEVKSRGQQLRQALGVMLCALLLFFAVESKVAAYPQHTPGLHTIAATKVWKTKSAQAPDVKQLVALVPVLLCLGLLCFVDERVAVLEVQDAAAPGESNWFSLHLAVRPPPAL